MRCRNLLLGSFHPVCTERQEIRYQLQQENYEKLCKPNSFNTKVIEHKISVKCQYEVVASIWNIVLKRRFTRTFIHENTLVIIFAQFLLIVDHFLSYKRMLIIN